MTASDCTPVIVVLDMHQQLIEYAHLAYIGEDLNGTTVQTWVANALSLVQAVGGPVLVSAMTSRFQSQPLMLAI